MFTATVKGFERFGEVTADIERLCLHALDDAAAEAAAVADHEAFIPLELEVFPAHGTVDGFTAGIVSHKRGKRGVRLAPIFDAGSLSGRTKKLEHGRRETWPVNRKGTAYTAHRHHPIVPPEGIEAQHFWAAARSVGRRMLLARIDRGV